MGLNQSAVCTGEATPPNPTLACTQYFFYPNDGPNVFLCQCNDGTWNHRVKQDSYSLCPSQVTTVSMKVAYYAETTVPPSVSCTLVYCDPCSVDYHPFYECSNDLFFAGACPSSVSAATTKPTLSEPLVSVTAVLTKGELHRASYDFTNFTSLAHNEYVRTAVYEACGGARAAGFTV